MYFYPLKKIHTMLKNCFGCYIEKCCILKNIKCYHLNVNHSFLQPSFLRQNSLDLTMESDA